MLAVPVIHRPINSEVLDAYAPVRPEGAGMIHQDADILGLGGEILIDPLLLFRSYLERQQVYSLILPLRCDQLGDQELRLGYRMDVTQEYDPVLGDCGL
jgi:hypothetical protein